MVVPLAFTHKKPCSPNESRPEDGAHHQKKHRGGCEVDAVSLTKVCRHCELAADNLQQCDSTQ